MRLHKDFQRISPGFGLIETLVSLFIAALLLVGAYKLFVSSTRKGSEAATKAKIMLQFEKLANRLATEARNIVVIPQGQSTVLRNKPPLSNSNCGSVEIPSSLLAYPGYERKNIETLGVNAIDPSDPNLISKTKPNDAFRFVFLEYDSQTHFLETNPASKGQYQVHEELPIILSGTDSSKIKIGDFLLISDEESSDLLRVTSKSGLELNQLEHQNSRSVWNASGGLLHTYGASGPNEPLAFVQKVGIRTYAYDPRDRNLYVDHHFYDDGFNPSTQKFSGPLGLAFRWVAIASNIDRFEISYDVSGANIPTRTPRAGELNDSTPGCSNQLGNPDLNRIRIQIKDPAGPSSWELNPENLRRGLPDSGEGLDLQRPPVTITPKATSTPEDGDPSDGGDDGSGPDDGSNDDESPEGPGEGGF